ncbi:MAG: dihydroorotate dehydrogenase electron transfer subunit [Pirellulaceae bacterium]
MNHNPLHANYYADQAIQRTARVLENTRIARDTFRLRFECPEMAEQILPGQFLMVRMSGLNDPLIGRPLAMYDTFVDGQGVAIAVDVVYIVKGKLTSQLQNLVAGQSVDVWGPLGNGFLPVETDHLIMVAGGIGQTPFVALGQESLGKKRYGNPPRDASVVPRVSLCYGARSEEFLAGLEDFQQAGVETLLCTDDGTCGHHGLVTERLEAVLRESSSNSSQVGESDMNQRIVCCGPEPMMEAVSKIAGQYQVPCQVSLETPMACGLGICFSCVAKIRDESGDWDYQRTCVEGPVFDSKRIVW